MTHNEERTHWLKETAIGLGVGVIYGVTNTMVGHPFDTMKTKMQAQAGFESGGMIKTMTTVFRKDGIRGLYRGCIPPLWGSGIYRSVQFAAFEGVYTFLDDSDFGRKEIPFTGGVQNRVVLGGMTSATIRACIECPLEVAKIRRQTNQTWKFRQLYTGFGVTWLRTMGLMTVFFIQIDGIRRHIPWAFTDPVLGPFLTTGFAATFAWWSIWPLEVMKSQKQGNYGESMSTWKRLQFTVRERNGIFGLYRGLLPGTIRGFLANGVSMVIMQWAQKKVSELGLRD